MEKNENLVFIDIGGGEYQILSVDGDKYIVNIRKYPRKGALTIINTVVKLSNDEFVFTKKAFDDNIKFGNIVVANAITPYNSTNKLPNFLKKHVLSYSNFDIIIRCVITIGSILTFLTFFN